MKALRSSEWLLIGYFAYVALISGPRLPLFIAAGIIALLAFGEARGNREFFSIARDWLPLALTLMAYREMDFFTPLSPEHKLEFKWVQWDRTLLHDWGVQRAIESLGAVIPSYLELCYLLVYAVGPFTVAVLYFARHRERVNQVLFLYLLGTLLAYAMFPFFLSEPPRTLFANQDVPAVTTALRRFNLWIVNGYGIHSSVFPSAHVSSAFSAGWALLKYLPERKRYGRGMLIYAVSVAIATVYGRYHYAADVVAGFGVSLVGLAIVYLPRMHTDRHG